MGNVMTQHQVLTHRQRENMKSTTGHSAAVPNPAPHSIPATIPLADDELVTATLAGNREAYRTLVERYQPRLLTMVTDVLKSREDAEDVVQESFVKAYLSLRSFKGQSSFYTWLYRITYNMAIDVRRKAGRRGGAHVEFKEGLSVNKAGEGESAKAVSALGEHLQNVEGPHDSLVRKETGSKIRKVLEELSDEHRSVIVLREVDGLNYEEIAEAIGVPRGTVMSRLHYARKALQKALKELAPFPFRGEVEQEEEFASDKEGNGSMTTSAAKSGR
jgi:RNA polymerase sigma-70 factor (ECF subfamily)